MKVAITSWNINCYEVKKLLAILNTTVIIYETMNEMNEKTQECHEYKRQLRLKKRQEQRRARLVRETNEQRERRLQRHREAERQRRQTQAEQGRRAKETSQETQKRLKVELQTCQQTSL